MENCWEHLQIEPTSDTAAIKKAYAKLLKFNKPDKNPEGFRNLRAAYEQALNESWWYEEDEESEEDDVADDFEDSETAAVPETVLHITLNEHSAANFEELIDAELLKVIQAQNDKQEAQYDEASEASVNDLYAEVEPIEQESAELLSYFEQAAIDEDSLESSDLEDQDSEEFNFEENNLEQETFTPYYSSQWSDEWQQICDDEESNATIKDHQLQTLFQSQLETPRSLDEQNEFEEELLVWLADQEPLFPLSYQLAKDHFHWDKRLEHWSHNEYPWYRLDSLDQRYKQVSYFQSPKAFHEHLTQYFPVAASYLTIESLSKIKNDYTDPNRLKQIKFFKRLFFSFRVSGLAQELNALDAELDYYIQDANHLALMNGDNDTFSAQYWQHNSAFTTLKSWIFNRFIQPKDFVVIATVIAILMIVLSWFSQQPGMSFYYDGLGVFATIMLYYLFWQLQLRLFATPDSFTSKEPWAVGWCNASILFFILGYISWLDIANLDTQNMPSSPIYFLTQLAGASLFASYSMRQDNIVIKAVTWHAAFLLLIITVLVPLLVFLAEQPPYDGDKTFAISPLLWLLLAAPAFLVNVSDTYTRLEWLANIGYKLLNIWSYLILIGVIIIYAYCVDILYEMHFGFTAVIVMIISIVVAVSKSKFLNSFEAN